MITNLIVAGLVLALLFIALILTKKNKLLQDYYLAFFIFLLGIYLILKYFFYHKLEQEFPIIIYLDIYFWVLLGPIIFIYTLISISKEKVFKTKYFLTLIPAGIVTILFYKYIFLSPLDFFVDDDYTYSIFFEIGAIVWLYNSPIFYILTIIFLRKHQNSINDYYSSPKSVDLKWLYYLSNGFALFLFVLLFKTALVWLFNLDVIFDLYEISIIITVIYIFGIGFFGLKQQGIFINPIVDQSDDNDRIRKQSNGNYQKSSIDDNEADKILQKLNLLMKEEEPFLECELNLPMLASKIDVSTNKLSQVINKYLNKNFFDYVNDYRIEKVKGLLSDSSYNHYKVIELAYQSGFNSKSTFYNLFKKVEGITPTEFRKMSQTK